MPEEQLLFCTKINQNQVILKVQDQTLYLEAECISDYKIFAGSFTTDSLPTQLKFVLLSVDKMYKYLQEDPDSRIQITQSGVEIIVTIIGEERKIKLPVESKEMTQERLKQIIHRLNTENKSLRQQSLNRSSISRDLPDSKQEKSEKQTNIQHRMEEIGEGGSPNMRPKTKLIKKQHRQKQKCDKKCKNCPQKVQYSCYDYCVDCYLSNNRWY